MIQFPGISPEIFSLSIFGFDFSVRWYSLAYVIGILAYLYGNKILMSKRKDLWHPLDPPLSLELIDKITLPMTIALILGGRIGYVLFYNPSYYLAHPENIIKVWEGGMSFHGGTIGIISAFAAYSFYYRIKFLSLLDTAALFIPLGIFLGRITNFINEELWGRETSVPWAIVFPSDPEQLPRHPSQIYEAFSEGALAGIIIYFLVTKVKIFNRPGTASGVFFLIYGLSRFAIEFLRQPDVQIGFVIFIGNVGITMGQILTFPLIFFGIFLIWFAQKKDQKVIHRKS